MIKQYYFTIYALHYSNNKLYQELTSASNDDVGSLPDTGSLSCHHFWKHCAQLIKVSLLFVYTSALHYAPWFDFKGTIGRTC